jgi:AbiU2
MVADGANGLRSHQGKQMTNAHEAEKRFEKYRDNLRREVGLLADYLHLFRGLHKHRKKYRFEIDSAPAFFSLITKSVFSTIILWADKLLDEKGQRGIFDFLKFIEANVAIFAIERLKRRRNFPDDHWVLQGRHKIGEITIKHVAKDLKRLKSLGCLQGLKTRRDRYHAHFDKKYFFNLQRLASDAPIALRDLGNAVKALSSIVNKYSSAYDGKIYEMTSSNINDFEYILYVLREFHKYRRKKYAD